MNSAYENGKQCLLILSFCMVILEYLLRLIKFQNIKKILFTKKYYKVLILRGTLNLTCNKHDIIKVKMRDVRGDGDEPTRSKIAKMNLHNMLLFNNNKNTVKMLFAYFLLHPYTHGHLKISCQK